MSTLTQLSDAELDAVNGGRISASRGSIVAIVSIDQELAQVASSHKAGGNDQDASQRATVVINN